METLRTFKTICPVCSRQFDSTEEGKTRRALLYCSIACADIDQPDMAKDHKWKLEGEMEFVSHPGCEIPHIHMTCEKCNTRAWFTEFQWNQLAKITPLTKCTLEVNDGSTTPRSL